MDVAATIQAPLVPVAISGAVLVNSKCYSPPSEPSAWTGALLASSYATAISIVKSCVGMAEKYI